MSRNQTIYVKQETIDFINNNRKYWTYEQLIALGRNPLLLPRENDVEWRFDWMSGLRKAGLIRKIDRKALSVYYLYVAVFMVDKSFNRYFPVWCKGQYLEASEINKAYNELESEGEYAEEAYQNVIKLIDAYLPEKQAEVIKTKYGFKDGKFYRSYAKLSKNMPKGMQYSESYLRKIELAAMRNLKRILPQPKV